MLSQALKLLRRIEVAAGVGLLGLIVVAVFIGSIGRYAGYPVLWTEELALALFIWLSMLAADLTLQRSGHFRLDMFTGLLPQKARLVLDVFVNALIAALLCILFVYSLRFVQISNLRLLPMLQVPSSWAAAAMPVGFLLMMITLLENTIREIKGGAVLDAQVRDVT